MGMYNSSTASKTGLAVPLKIKSKLDMMQHSIP